MAPRRGQPYGVFGEAEPVTDRGAGMVVEARTSRPDGSRCSHAAIWRTSRPRALGDSAGSAASRIN